MKFSDGFPILSVCHACRWVCPSVVSFRDAMSAWPHGDQQRPVARVWVGGQLLPIVVGL